MRALVNGSVVVALGTWLAAMRNRLLLVSLVFAVVLVGLSVAAASVSLGDQGRLIIDVGLAAASGIGSVIAIALAVTSFARELSSRTAYAVLVRPLPRAAFLLGKYLGLLVTMVLVTALMVVATAVIVWLYGGTVPAAFWGSMELTFVEMAVVLAIALLFSTMTVPVLAATYAAGVVIAGNLADDLVRMAAKASGTTRAALHLAYAVLPDLGKLSLREQAANALAIPAAYVVHGTLYGAIYAATALLIAMLIFQRRKVI